jgi:uncharacterized membrane protein YagU involved in acid resistance
MSEIETIALAGAVTGILDLAVTTTVVRAQGITFQRLLHRIASGALGDSAYTHGASSARLGLFFHLLIAFSAATVYCLASRYLAVLLTRPWLMGALFGIAVHLFMTFVVIPLSAAPRPFSTKAFLTQLVIHILFVGLPIALIVSRFATHA